MAIQVDLKRRVNLKRMNFKAFGIIKKRKMSGQEFKDMVRKGWEIKNNNI